jgi:hypothetical protein
MIPVRWLVLALAAALVSPPARAQSGCDSLCQAKVRFFDLYMDQIDIGRPKYALPEVVQEVLRPYYPGADLSAVRFAYSDQQPLGNATTDCNQIYFNSESYVSALRDAAPSSNLVWLLHELVHPEQCAAAGGREGYAMRWWDELEKAVSESGATIDVFQSRDRIVKQLQALWPRVHDSMPMERDAQAKAETVLADLQRCCVAEDGTLRRPASAQ